MPVINPANFNERVDVPKGALINVHQSDGGRLAFDLVEFDPSGSSSVPDATTSVKGIVKLAPDGGTDAGTAVQGNDARLSGALVATVTNPQIGDVVQWDGAKWINHVPTGEGIAATVHLTSAQLQHIVATPITLLPAQGPGTVIWPLHAFAVYTFGTTPYTIGNFGYLWIGSPTEQVAQSGWMSWRDLFSLGADTIDIPSLENATGAVALGLKEDTALVVYGAGGGDELADGDGTVDIYYRYTVMTL